MPPLPRQALSTLIEYVRLADAYQHIGKVEYGTAWVDHEIGVFRKHQTKAISLANPEFIQSPQKRIIEPQYKRITSVSLRKAPSVLLDREGITRHTAMQQFIEKLIMDEAFQLRFTNGLERRAFSEFNRQSVTSIHFDYVRSEAAITDREGVKTTYQVLVTGQSLRDFLTSLTRDRKRRSKPESNAGRKVTSSSQLQSDMILGVIKKHPKIKSVKELAELAQPRLHAEGYMLTVGAIEKRITRNNLLAAKPSARAKKT